MNWTAIVALLPAILAELAKTFPAAGTDPVVTTTLLSAQSSFIKHTQEILNAAQTAGISTFGPVLTVDGIVGPKTTAAMQALLTKFGLSTI